MTASTLALLLASTLQAPAPADPFETRLHNVEFLTRPVEDHPALELFGLEDMGLLATADQRSFQVPLEGEALVELIRANIEEDSWQHAGAALSYSDGILVATNLRSVQERIAAYLDYWRGFFGRIATLEVWVVAADPATWVSLRAPRGDRPAVLAADQAERLLAGAREGKAATLLKSLRGTALPGQRFHVTDLSWRPFLGDWDVQVAPGSAMVDPIPGGTAYGLVVDARIHREPFGDAVTLEVRIDRADVKALTERAVRIPREVLPAWPVPSGDARNPATQLTPPAGSRVDEVRLQLPQLDWDSLRATLTLRSGETAVAGTTTRGGRHLVYLVRPTLTALDDAPAAEPAFDEERLLKMYDISPLTRHLQDFAAPSSGPQPVLAGSLASPSFTLEEAMGQQGTAEQIVETIRTRIAAETWANRRNQITVLNSGTLLVRQRPEVLKEIDGFLGVLLQSRVQTVTIQACLIGLRKPGRADWEGRILALRAGGYFVPDEAYEALLQEAAKGGPVRIVEAAEIAAHPQQRVFAARLQEERMLSDLEPVVSTAAGQPDLLVETIRSGLVLDVRPHFIRGLDRVSLDLSLRRWDHAVEDSVPPMPGASPLQQASWAGLGRRMNVVCKDGHVTLVGAEQRGSGPEAEEVLFFVRARANRFK